MPVGWRLFLFSDARLAVRKDLVLNAFLKHWVTGNSVSIYFLAAMEDFSRIVPNRMGMMLPTGWESCSQPLGLLFPTVGNSSH
ncbi:conserved domain protein [Prevotella denticola CRIS 18C-A]|uniref:Conserved domain protein n=1 Tax=Prevotella denticola CRIS 18C-A TaxID=944557 RepID=F0H3V8_9BACT|nr:conserved domain protein [Prevotella denticola CRIS 18C-A]